MEIVNLDQAEPVRTTDGSEIRELLARYGFLEVLLGQIVQKY